MEDRQEPVISKTGVWVDLDTDQVVEAEPVHGKLLVAPGGEVNQSIVDDIAAAKAVTGQTDVPEPEPVRRGRPPGSKNKATVPDDTEKATE